MSGGGRFFEHLKNLSGEDYPQCIAPSSHSLRMLFTYFVCLESKSLLSSHKKNRKKKRVNEARITDLDDVSTTTSPDRSIPSSTGGSTLCVCFNSFLVNGNPGITWQSTIAGFAKPGSFVFPLGCSLPPASKGYLGPRGFNHFLSSYHS